VTIPPLLLASLALLFAASPLHAAAADAALVQVVLVRHAEKAAAPPGDPGLTEEGKQRALALADALQAAGIRRIVTSDYARTRETAAPLATQLNIEPVAVANAGDIDAHVREVVRAVHAGPGPVLVVGHSNTVPAIILALGGPPVPPIDDDHYDRLYVLSERDGTPLLVQARYGR
jgi:broad specificity phosphatase PhoE